MKKRIVALVLARGAFNGSSQPNVDLKYKALMPVQGIPMVDYVVRALQESAAEKIFIVQGPDEGLEWAVRDNSKNAFIDCDSGRSSYTDSLFSGLIKLADYYGPDELCKIEIMLVPCDIPLADSGNFNRLMAANDDKNTDVCTCLIRSELLKGRYPERKFPRFYCSDLGEDYCMQNFAFISGRTLAVCLYGASFAREWHCRPLPSTLMADFATKADNLVSLRQTRHVIPLIVCETFWWLAREGSILQAMQMLGKLLFRRCTTQDFKKFVFLASGLNADYIDSQEAELSFDVDQSEHLDALSDQKSLWSAAGSTI